MELRVGGSVGEVGGVGGCDGDGGGGGIEECGGGFDVVVGLIAEEGGGLVTAVAVENAVVKDGGILRGGGAGWGG